MRLNGVFGIVNDSVVVKMSDSAGEGILFQLFRQPFGFIRAGT